VSQDVLVNDAQRPDRSRQRRKWGGPEWFDPLWLFFPNTLAVLVMGLVLPFVLVILVLVLGFAGLLR
jgi:hypothetical protein